MGYSSGNAGKQTGGAPGRWPQQLRRLAKWDWKIAGRLLEWAASAAVGMAVVWGWAKIENRWQQTPFREIWRPVVQGADSIPIVIGGVRLDTFTPNGTNKPARLPNNVLLVGVDDGMGMSLLRESFARAFGHLRVTLHEPQDFGDKNLTSFISVGGPSVNSVTGRILANMTGIRMFYPEHYAMVGQRRFSAEEDRQGNVIKDFGFIIMAPNPLAQAHHVCVVFGIWPYGTSAALQVLSRPDPKDKLFQQFARKVRSRSPVLAVLETKVQDLQRGTPTLIEVKDLALR